MEPNWLMQFIDLILHLDKHLNVLIQQYGTGTYGILFLIVFCETGLVVTPFLPGDSLLFATGTFVGLGSLDLGLTMGLLVVAAVLGDAVNYAVGKYMGPRVLTGNVRFLRKEYLDRTRQFYERYGSKTIVIARFVPIVRTFAPFLAGVGKMGYGKFAMYNIAGGVLWVSSCVMGGYFFGNMPIVKSNFSLVILGIIFVSILPAVIEVVRAQRMTNKPAP